MVSQVWSYEAIESDDEKDQSGGMEEDSEHPRLSPAEPEFFTTKKGETPRSRVIEGSILGWKKKVELGLGLGELLRVKVDMLIWEEVWKVEK